MSYDFTKTSPAHEQFWMPFTPQRLFKSNPRMMVSADGMYYTDQDGRKVLDGIAGLWCTNAGHNHPKIKEAVKAQIDTLDYAPNFQYGHPTAFEAAKRLTDAMPDPFTHVFFSNSGSEAVDTALKIALGYHRAKGDGQRRVLIGRERGYHGVGFGGISVGGIPYTCAYFGQRLPDIDHIVHTWDLEHNAFSKGEPEWGAHLADDLLNTIYLNDPSNIAAVIIEPVAGSTGILPPPKGYLKRIREICDEYGILLIFDEVVTAFGRMGEMSSTTYFDVMPDIIVSAKGLTNGAVPMGATFVTSDIYDTFMNGPREIIELMHGYTYSGHPLACAAAIGTLDAFEEDNILENARKMMPIFEEAVHSLKDKPYVMDIRNCGMIAGVQLENYSDDDPMLRTRTASYELFNRGAVIRYSGPTMQLSPSLTINEKAIDQLVTMLGDVLDDIGSGKVSGVLA